MSADNASPLFTDLGLPEHLLAALREVGYESPSPIQAATLVQTSKITNFPIVLLGTDYWGGLVDWISTSMLTNGMIGRARLRSMNCMAKYCRDSTRPAAWIGTMCVWCNNPRTFCSRRNLDSAIGELDPCRIVFRATRRSSDSWMAS